MKIGFLITARLKSTRLPNKLILKIFDREIIRWMIDRLKLSNELDVIVLCTSNNSQDNELIEIAKQENIFAYRGSEEDVIERLYEAAIFFKLDYVVNVTADCPLTSIEYIRRIVETYKQTNADLVRCLDLPYGLFSYGIKIDALKKICEIKNSKHTEVWGRYFTDTGIFKVVDIVVPKELQRPKFRLTLDYKEDFEFFNALFNHFGEDTFRKDVADIVKYLDEHPEVVEINNNCIAAFQNNWNSQNNILLKNE